MPEFENPAAFLFLLVIPFLYIMRALKIFKRTAFPLVFADWNGKSFGWNGKLSHILSFLALFFCVSAYVLLTFALAEPVIHHQEKVYTSKGADVLFVLDTSPSMASRDIGGMTRLNAARQGIHTLVNNNRGAAFGLIAMASEAAVVVPPTADHELFLRRLDSLVIGGLGEGSAIGTGLSSAVYHLISSKAPRKCIVLITDGENNAGSVHPDTAAELAAQNNITLYTFGIGTKGSVPIEYIDPNTGKVHSGFYDSDFDTAPLESIAYAGGGRYFGIESTNALSEALSLISRRETVIQTFHYKSSDQALYPYYLLAAAVLFALAWLLRRVILKEVL
jgi:Ca-activated chloride channel family protein